MEPVQDAIGFRSPATGHTWSAAEVRAAGEALLGCTRDQLEAVHTLLHQRGENGSPLHWVCRRSADAL